MTRIVRVLEEGMISLFGGGAGADYSARRLGYRHLLNIEHDPKIASVAELNGFATMVADVCAVDFTSIAVPYWLHMSPPCTNASNANSGAGETIADINLAAACIRAIESLRSPRISLENVWPYREFESFRGSTKPGDKFNFEGIVPALRRNGYNVAFWHLNAANYGIPQTRKRLCLVASKDHTPRRPLPTHEENPDPFNMFALLPWVGWYEAIEDLIPSLSDSAFAPWQLERLPEDLKTCLIDSRNAGQQWGKLYRDAYEPALTVTADGKPSHQPRAFVVDCRKNGSAGSLTIRADSEPMYTLTATMERRPARVLITNDQELHGGLEIGPRPTNKIKADVGRVVKMTPRALARFNGLGDDYLLPTSNALACAVLGNMHILQGPMMEANP